MNTESKKIETLSFDDAKITELNLDQLKQTLALESAKGGLPRNRPIEHFNLIENIQNLAMAANLNIQMDPIWVTESGAARIQWKGEKDKCPLQNYLIQRLTTRIHLTKGNENGINVAIALSYHDKGISVAFGINVRACSNQSIFGDNMWNTYGQGSVPFEKGMEVLAHWISQYDSRFDEQLRYVNLMKQQIVTNDDVDMIIGKLFINAVKFNSGDREQYAPLNVTQCSRFVEEYNQLIRNEEHKNKPLTLWQLANNGTAILKPRTSNIIDMLECNRKFNNFLLETFRLN